MRLFADHILKTRLTALLAVLFAWISIICVVPQAAHACCKSSQANIHKEMPCCVQQAVVTASDQAPQKVSDPALPLVTVIPVFDFSSLLSAVDYSFLASAWLPDQSNRYLELRVLLN